MLSLKNLTISYGKIDVVKSVSLTVASGEIVALIGPNGAGKTSLVRGVSGVIQARRGEILFNGLNINNLSAPERARILAVVPQVSYVGGAFTVEQAIMMGRTAYMSWLGKPSDEDFYHVEQAMLQTKTIELADRRIAQLSGGEQQRVMLARALAQNTPLLVLDEPTNHLDLRHQATILSLVKEQTINRELAVLMVLHDLNLVSLFADKAALMVNGEISAFGEPSTVLREEIINEAYQTDIEVVNHPKTNIPIILHKDIRIQKGENK